MRAGGRAARAGGPRGPTPGVCVDSVVRAEAVVADAVAADADAAGGGGGGSDSEGETETGAGDAGEGAARAGEAKKKKKSKKKKKKPASGVPAGEHPLASSWTFWFDRKLSKEAWAELKRENPAATYRDQLKQLGTVRTVEDFWRHYVFLKRPSELEGDLNLSLFREGNMPLWEVRPRPPATTLCNRTPLSRSLSLTRAISPVASCSPRRSRTRREAAGS